MTSPPNRLRVSLPAFVGRGATVSSVLMMAGIAITGVFILLALLAPPLQAGGILQDPTAALQNPVHQAPSLQYWFGTTRQGYDVLSRVIFGSRAAWQVVLLATAISVLLGVPLGMVSGYRGGRLDRVVLFFMDTLYTLPGLLLSVTLAFVVGRGVVNAAVALSIAYVPQYYRVVRNHTVSVKTELFIEAAQAMGASTRTVLSRYLFLNVIQSVPGAGYPECGRCHFDPGGLGFLAWGCQSKPPGIWGADIRQALDALPTGIWWPALFPGLALTAIGDRPVRWSAKG
ncbi:glycine betaine transporter membrane protein [Halomicronema hongdechloris C2206]|uniref:Glycine betaine transporter membrane protein n=1 Tax=Halomicronema hongdechloris C2206 TaxID=1641165 RepID=A0A1Z3HFV0_9CYAN|nr:ABC transporter permease [Halomicronema hongdechloris]ASC69174.1 glycine betaine transporter membrane protein [Halomicronema hongdechloris C2206]